MPRPELTSRPGPLWIKVCGLTSAANLRDVLDILQPAGLRLDAIGLNFVPGSVRQIDLPTARSIVAALPADVLPVALFANASLPTIREALEVTDIRCVQLHGDEAPAFLEEITRACPNVALIKAWHWTDPSLADWADYWQQCVERGCPPAAVLFDAAVPGQLGGTGHTLAWDQLDAIWHAQAVAHGWPPLILAGGLKPENVAQAARVCRPWGLDVASGVEAQRGVKSPELVRDFVAAAEQAARELGRGPAPATGR